MSRRAWFVLAVLVVALAACSGATAPASASAAGVWSGRVFFGFSPNIASLPLTLTLTDSASVIAGSGALDTVALEVRGTRSGSTLSLQFSVSGGDGALVAGTLNGAAFRGNMNAQQTLLFATVDSVVLARAP